MALTLAPQTGLTTRNTRVKYESCMTYNSKVIAHVKLFCGQTDKQTNGPTDKQTGQTLYDPDLSMRGHNKYSPNDDFCL